MEKNHKILYINHDRGYDLYAFLLMLRNRSLLSCQRMDKKMIELTVTIKGEDSTFKQKFLIYDPVTMTRDDPIIKDCIETALDSAKITPESIKIKTLMLVT